MRTRLILFFLLVLVTAGPAWASRDAAFQPPIAGGSGTIEEAIKVEPKNEIDLGDTPISLGRRATFFFVNQSSQTVNIEGVTANGDSNVKAEIMADDCTRGKSIQAGSRCSVTIEVTPAGYGSWAAELLFTHDGAGRIARAKALGKTGGMKTEKQDAGLAISTKDIKPVDFGEVEIGTDKAVRSALMVNDSNENITILSIEVIAPDNGLETIDQGCAPDMELKVGESCPVTLMWKPQTRGNVSTDLIIRHSGRLGFAVIPIRGKAKEPKDGIVPSTAVSSGKTGSGSLLTSGTSRVTRGSSVPPPSLDDVQNAIAGKIAPLSVDGVEAILDQGDAPVKPKIQYSVDEVKLIGTVGSRAVLYLPDGSTKTASVGDEVSLSETSKLKVLAITARQAEIQIGKDKKKLVLTSVESLRERSVANRKETGSFGSAKTSTRGASSSSSLPLRNETNSVDLPATK